MGRGKGVTERGREKCAKKLEEAGAVVVFYVFTSKD